MKCAICKRGFSDDELVLPLVKYVTNERRGDFVTQSVAYIHLRHVTECKATTVIGS